MGYFSKKDKAAEPEIVAAGPESASDEKGTATERSSEEHFGASKQAGVKKIEAVAQNWTKWDLIAAYGL